MQHSVADGTSPSAAERSSRAAGERRKLLASRGWRLTDAPAAWLLITPVIILFGISVIFPLFETIRLSFFDIKGLGKPKYVELGNYIKLFADSAFRNTLTTTLIFPLATTAVSVSIGWMLAMLCAFAPRQTLSFRVMIFAAFGISEAVAGYMWIGIFPRPSPRSARRFSDGWTMAPATPAGARPGSSALPPACVILNWPSSPLPACSTNSPPGPCSSSTPC